MNSAALKRIYLFSVPFPATFMIPGGAVHHCARAATTFVLLPSPPPPVYTRCTGAGCDEGIDFRPSFHPYSTQTRDSRNLRHGFLVSLLSVDYGSLTDSPKSCGMCVTQITPFGGIPRAHCTSPPTATGRKTSMNERAVNSLGDARMDGRVCRDVTHNPFGISYYLL